MRQLLAVLRFRARTAAGKVGGKTGSGRSTTITGRPSILRRPSAPWRKGRAWYLLLPAAAALCVTGVVAALGVGLAAAGQRAAPAQPAPAAQVAAGSPATSVGEPGADEEMLPPKQPTVVSAGQSRFGPILVGEEGRTLYVFSADRPGDSSCTGACAQSWLPVLSHGGKPQGSASVPAAMIGSIQRADGTYQVTAWRQPLYYYAGDHQPGDVNGQGRAQFGGTWRLAAPGGKS
jgi:predicted lipoprotein with Yx(FWY)xxD motif